MRKEKEIFLKKIIKTTGKLLKKILMTQNNIFLKFKVSLLVTSPLIYTLAVTFQKDSNPEAANIFEIISGILLFLFYVLVQNNESVVGLINGFVYSTVIFIILIYSLNFSVNTNVNYHGFQLIFYSIVACAGLLLFTFFLISKFIDIYNFICNLFNQLKEKLFNSPAPNTSKLNTLIEHITALFATIGSLTLAIKAIVEPLVNFSK